MPQDAVRLALPLPLFLVTTHRRSAILTALMNEAADIALCLERIRALIERLESEQTVAGALRDTAIRLRSEAIELMARLQPLQLSDLTERPVDG